MTKSQLYRDSLQINIFYPKITTLFNNLICTFITVTNIRNLGEIRSIIAIKYTNFIPKTLH